MEPAAEGREHSLSFQVFAYLPVPKWGPPVSGGSTGDVDRLGDVPADAPMGPAAERREHIRAYGTQGTVYAPQWGPPVNGGSTVYQQLVFVDANHPQWSPPLNGGNTSPRDVTVISQSTVLQWSPPVNGGSRYCARRPSGAWRMPQWNPPLNGGSTGDRKMGVCAFPPPQWSHSWRAGAGLANSGRSEPGGALVPPDERVKVQNAC